MYIHTQVVKVVRKCVCKLSDHSCTLGYDQLSSIHGLKQYSLAESWINLSTLAILIYRHVIKGLREERQLWGIESPAI